MTVREATRTVIGGQWPIIVVGLIFVAAFGLVVAEYWRRGGLLIGIGAGVAAALRLVLSESRAGLLVVRGRMLDVSTMALVSAAVIYIAWTIDPLGTG